MTPYQDIATQPSELLDRLPPQDLEAERGVIGSLLLDPLLCDEVALLLRKDDFYAGANQLLYQHIMDMHNEGIRVDSLLLLDRLKLNGDLETAGGAAYIGEVINSVPTAANAEHYAGIVRDKATLRSLIHASTEFLGNAYDRSADASQVLATAAERMTSLSEASGHIRAVPFSEAAQQVFANLDRADDVEPGLGTGFSKLDSMTGGLRPGALWVLAARTGQGKTALASTVAEAVAFDQRRPALFVSLEMENAEVVQRTLGRRGRVQASRIRDHRLSPGERDDLLEAHAAIGKDAPLWLCDHESCTVADISGLARRHKRQHGLDLLVVDYLQLIETDNPKDTRQEQVARICRRLKKLARQLQVPVLVLAQLNREADKGDAKPRLSHLRESGAIEQDADVVLLLQRFDSDDLRGTANLAVAKARNGAVGDVPLKWEPEFISYLPAEADEQPVDWIEQQTMCGSF